MMRSSCTRRCRGRSGWLRTPIAELRTAADRSRRWPNDEPMAKDIVHTAADVSPAHVERRRLPKSRKGTWHAKQHRDSSPLFARILSVGRAQLRPRLTSMIRPLPIRRWCCAFVAVLLVGTAAITAQSRAERYHESWRWVRFVAEDGLAANDVHDLVETSDGLVWAATTSGLSWFDGWRWFTCGEEQGLPPGPIFSLAVGADDVVWVAVASGIFRGGKDGFTRLRATDDAIGRSLVSSTQRRGAANSSTTPLKKREWATLPIFSACCSAGPSASGDSSFFTA